MDHSLRLPTSKSGLFISDWIDYDKKADAKAKNKRKKADKDNLDNGGGIFFGFGFGPVEPSSPLWVIGAL
jgi:hypothetical protein